MTVALVGCGPAGTSLLERLCANARDTVGARPLHIHVIDPCLPGGGRVWRRDAASLMWANSRAAHITLFTDEATTCAGPIGPGPSLWEWGRDRAAELRGRRLDPELAPLADELARLTPMWFPSRGLVGAYMAWVFRTAVASAPPGVRVFVHRDSAVDVADVADDSGRQRVELAGGACVVVDAVVLTQGHLDAEPDAGERRFARYAEHHGLRYLPCGYTAEQDLEALRPGERVIARGMGLAFVDLVVRTTSGRGGAFVRDADGTLVYRPSGHEPVLYAASRQGVPYRAKFDYELVGEQPPLPRFLTAAALARRPGRGALDWRRDLRPLLAREMAWAYYHRLCTAHPERTTMAWDTFAAEFTALDDAGHGASAADRAACEARSAALVARAVPDPADRFDLARLERPLAGRRFPSPAALQAAITAHIADTLARGTDPRHSPDLAANHALQSGFDLVARLLDDNRISERSRRDELPGFLGFYNSMASGPPSARLEEILALARAGVIRFLGAEVVVGASGDAFAAHSPSVPDTVLRARTLVEARLPAPSVSRSRDPLVRALFARGEITEESVAGHASGRIRAAAGDHRLITADGTPHPARFALGHGVAGGVLVSGFSRPRADPPPLRVSDALARRVLTALVARDGTGDPGDAPPGPGTHAADPTDPPRAVRVVA
ncbi:FAD/NAD(P)-binding protein [Yinghuangia sp. ASG 101]|uniref:FAD/NAD(P)-binding protein n=1 Tax=Yinghuangia sp. ASG 101 TaxID=2896848 RepID=UPI001E3BA6E9|nr:FAD/NAD(P)-binding protein [Yinghuangia sp. ASG 101]UGQ09644.1 FAD/NAD(P)-binding protein [Yinghuangia sp. ASG 101]